MSMSVYKSKMQAIKNKIQHKLYKASQSDTLGHYNTADILYTY